MSKKYNYFDDEQETRPRTATRKRKKTKITFKMILQIIALLFKEGAKSTGKFVRSITTTDEKHINKQKRNAVIVSSIAIILVAVIIILSFFVSINKENKREQLFNENAGNVCTKDITEYGACNYESLSDEGVTGYRMTGLCYAREIDFNNDGESELLICYNNNGTYYAEVWGFVSDDFSCLYKNTITQTSDVKDDVWLTIYSKNSKYYIVEHDEKDISNATIFSMHSKKFTKKTTCTYDSETEVYSVKGEEEPNNFERIKMSVLREVTASNLTEQVLDTIDNFTDFDESIQANTTDETTSMNSAYYNLVCEYNDKYGKAKYITALGSAYIDGLAVVDLIDFDGNGTDELVLIYRRDVSERTEDNNGDYVSVTKSKYYCDIYTYNGTSAVRVYQDEGLSNTLNSDYDVYYIIRHDGGTYQLCSNTFKSSNYGREITAVSKIKEFDGTRFNQTFKSSYETNYGYTDYYIDDEWVYKSKFSEKGGYTVPLFDGTTDYDSAVYTVTYLQTKYADADKIKGIPSSTVAKIKKLNSNYVGE